mgnify:CR=1 FL=1
MNNKNTLIYTERFDNSFSLFKLLFIGFCAALGAFLFVSDAIGFLSCLLFIALSIRYYFKRLSSLEFYGDYVVFNCMHSAYNRIWNYDNIQSIKMFYIVFAFETCMIVRLSNGKRLMYWLDFNLRKSEYAIYLFKSNSVIIK